MLTGSFLCGGVTFTVTATAKDPAACHCTQCRKQSGHIWASVQVPLSAFEMQGDVRWFEASDTAKRGFCPTCGSFLFWKAFAEDTISFSMGSVDGASGLALRKHIFTGTKGDYYDIGDDVPQTRD